MSSEFIEYLAAAGQSAPSADNSQPWEFGYNGNDFIVKLVNDDSGQGLELNHPAMLLSLGCVAENITQALNFVGISDRVGEFLPEASLVRFRIGADLPEIDSEIKAALAPLYERQTNRFSYHNIPLSDETKKAVEVLNEGSAAVKLFDRKEDVEFIAALVKDSAEARFQSEDIHEWLGNSLRMSDEEASSGNGLDIRTLDLPPGGGFLLALTRPWSRMKFFNRFGLHKLFAMVESLQVKKAPCLIGITAPLGSRGAFEAGMLMERVWISLNQAGLSVHPYFVLPDQISRFHENQVPEPLREFVGLIVSKMEKKGFGANNHLHMLLRVGEGKVSPLRSRRCKPEISLSSDFK